jgi:16S rRNA (uracil1498-N3)-methyltransferase
VVPALRSAAAHAFVADLASPQLEEEDRHHLERVLRLRPGQVVTVSDGAGGWRCCAWRAGGELEPAGDVSAAPGLWPLVTVGFALTKGERPDWAVQKLTEVGVDRILCLVTARSVVRPDAEAVDRRLQRWRRVAREAAMQSRRTVLPEVVGVLGVADVVAEAVVDVVVDGAAGPCPGGFAAALAEPGGESPSLDRPVVLVGPEGGWAPDELASGLPTVDLGSGVLRTESAAVAAGVLLCSLRAGLVGEKIH